MKKTSQKILFFGNERLATGVGSTAPTFRALLASGYEIAALISSYTQARSRRNREPEIHEVARQHNIPIISPKRMSDIHAALPMISTVCRFIFRPPPPPPPSCCAGGHSQS